MKQFKHAAGVFLLGLLGLGTTASAQSWQPWIWAKRASTQLAGAITTASTTATVIRPAGDVYSAYRHNGTLVLGNVTYPANGQQDNAVLAHHDQSGNVTGAAMVITNGTISDLKLDGAGNMYASGRFGGQITAGTTQVSAVGTSDFFVAKWDAAGTLQWIQKATSTQGVFGASATAVAIDANGYVTLGAGFSGSATFGSQVVTATSPQMSSLLLAQYDAAGTLRWVQASNNTSVLNFGGLAAAPDGTLHVVGTAFGAFSWPSITVTTTSTQNGFWLKLDAAGAALDFTTYGNNGQGINAPRVATDQMGLPYVAVNSYASTLNWGSNTFSMPVGGRMGFFVAGLNTNGVPRWVKSGSMPDSSYATVNAMSAVSDLNDGNNVRVYLGGNFINSDPASALQYGPFSVSTGGFQRGEDGFLMSVDGSTGQPNWLIPAVESNAGDYLDVLSANAAGQISVGGAFTGDTAVFGNIRLLNPSARQWSAYTAKRVQDYNLVQGTIFTDANANGTQDSGDFGRSGVVVEVQPGNFYFASETDGQYSAIAELGNYTLSVPTPPLYYTAVPTGPNTVSFSTYGILSPGHHFALQPVGPSQDLQVNVTPVGRARPGFTVTYRVTYRNVGTVPMTGGSLQFDFASVLTYLSSSQPVLQSGNSLTWTYATLQPGEVGNVDILFQIPTTATLGSTLVSTANIEPLTGDLTPADNSEINHLTVTGSYDPNDISVNYDLLTPQQVQNGEWLEYTIRFQNMGTDTAFSVLLRDALPAQQLRLGTLQLISASHNCTWGLNPDGQLSVNFPNISLPHRNANSIRSQGFVRFRVRPLGSLAIGDIIPNQADIFFDFNAPVTTNTATTEVNTPTGLPTAKADVLPGSVWPNPASGTVNVEVSTSAPVVLTLLDATGRTVLTHVATAQRDKLDVNGLPAGLYLLRAQAGSQSFTKRVVLR